MEIEVLSPININTICRFCLCSTNDEITTNALVEHNKPTPLNDIISEINIQITTIENMPNTICNKCKDKIYSFHEFKSNIQKNEEILRELLSKDQSGNFRCSVCNLNFGSFYQYSKHMVQHNVNKSLLERCTITSDTSVEDNTDVLELIQEKKNTLTSELFHLNPIKERKHKKVVNKVVKCDICSLSCENEVRLGLHVLQHSMFDKTDSRDPTIYCNICGLLLNTTSEYKCHLTEHKKFENKTWPCDQCDTDFPNEFKLLHHQHNSCECIIEELEGNFNCQLCDCFFTTTSTLIAHALIHLVKRYNCKDCKKKFLTDKAFYQHQKSHARYKYQCHICNKLLSSNGGLNKHIVAVHNNMGTLEYTCEICGKNYKTKSILRQHKRLHKMIKNFICSTCGYNVDTLYGLKSHQRIHTNERPFKCTFEGCDKGFKTHGQLNDHVKSHLKLKVHKCEVCEMRFSRSHTLRQHSLIHTGEKPFHCKMCTSTFRTSTFLKMHVKTHRFVKENAK